MTVTTDTSELGWEEMHSLLQALPGNAGIEHVSLRSIDISNEIWSLAIRSLSAHPRITHLSIENRWNSSCRTDPSQYSVSELHPPPTGDESNLF
jgi:hypothetical protein